MLYQVIKGAFDAHFITRIEDFAADLPMVESATVEEDDNSTRKCDVRWINYGTPEFAFAADRIPSALRAACSCSGPRWWVRN